MIARAKERDDEKMSVITQKHSFVASFSNAFFVAVFLNYDSDDISFVTGKRALRNVIDEIIRLRQIILDKIWIIQLNFFLSANHDVYFLQFYNVRSSSITMLISYIFIHIHVYINFLLFLEERNVIFHFFFYSVSNISNINVLGGKKNESMKQRLNARNVVADLQR